MPLYNGVIMSEEREAALLDLVEAAIWLRSAIQNKQPDAMYYLQGVFKALDALEDL
jgi:hypothetical protein